MNMTGLFRLSQMLFILTIAATNLMAQQPGVLFTLDNQPVYTDEFAYIYAKTNGPKASYTLASLSEYLELYKRFKLKVRRARDMKLDTLPGLKQELAGYRKQLAANYLIDKEVTEQLLREVYERTQKDIRFSHVLVKLEENASPEDTLAAWNKIQEAYQMALNSPFEQVTSKYSEDENSAGNGGDLGYFTATFPNGYYNLETAVYTSPKGKPSKPFRTKLGYHIIYVTDIRDARGEVEASHILIRKTPLDKGQAKTRIDSIYQALQNGANFEELARQLSEDGVSASRGGNIGVFGIQRYEKPFEDVAFGLKKEGDISHPVETSTGWHIVKLIKKITAEPYEQASRRLEPKIKRDERFELARESMIDKLKSEIGVVENAAVYEKYEATQNDTLFTFYWRPLESSLRGETILTLGSTKKITVGQFEDFLQKNSATRTNLKRTHSLQTGLRSLMDDFIKDQCIVYEEDRLEEKYPEFKALMQEYEEGILLFEATKRMVWDKSSADTTGLVAFFNQQENPKYTWGERARVSYYQFKSTDEKLLEKVRDYASGKSSEATLKKFNKGDAPILTVKEILFEHGKSEALDQMAWKPGNLSYNERDLHINGWNFFKIEEVLPPQPKSLDEARGFVIADYQDMLEREWVNQLIQEYPIRVNQTELQKLIRK